MKTGYVEYLEPIELARLPKGQGASPAMQHKGGSCPVHPLQPVSIWLCNPHGSWWDAKHTASAHDWSKPCIYRTRTPKPGHPMLAEARREKLQAQAQAPVIVMPLETIAQDFTRLVDAIENYLSRCDAELGEG